MGNYLFHVVNLIVKCTNLTRNMWYNHAIIPDKLANIAAFLVLPSPCRLSHYPILPNSIDINWGVHPPPSIESIFLGKVALYRM